jgi:N utilization substance protein A
MNLDLAYRLAQNGVVTMEDLAEQSVDELLSIDEAMGEEQAAQLIMKAREPWFAEQSE